MGCSIFKISYEEFNDYKNFCNKYLIGIYIAYRNDKTSMQVLLSKDNIVIYNGKEENEEFKTKINNLKKNNGISVLFNESNGCLCTFFKNKNLAECFEYQLQNVYNLKAIKGLINFVIAVRKNIGTLQYSKKRSVTVTEEVLNQILLKRYNRNIEYMPCDSSKLEMIFNLKNNKLKEDNLKEYEIFQENLNIKIKYENDRDLIEKLDSIICDLITFGYEPFGFGTDRMLQAIQDDQLYGEDFIVTNENYDKDIKI